MRAYIVCFAALATFCLIGCGGGGEVGPSGLPPSEITCTLANCRSGASYYGDFPLNGNDPNRLELTTCFNASCEVTPIQFVGSNLYFDCPRGNRTTCWLLIKKGAATVTLGLNIGPPPAVDPLVYLQDGDHYEASIGLPGQAPLLRLDTFATYTINQPNGPRCGPTCKGTLLTPAQ